MLLSIDVNRLNKELSRSKERFKVTSSNLGAMESLRFEEPSLSIGGTTMYGTYRSSSEAREYMATSRRRIETSGSKLKNVPELMKEIEDMRSGRR